MSKCLHAFFYYNKSFQTVGIFFYSAQLYLATRCCCLRQQIFNHKIVSHTFLTKEKIKKKQLGKFGRFINWEKERKKTGTEADFTRMKHQPGWQSWVISCQHIFFYDVKFWYSSENSCVFVVFNTWLGYFGASIYLLHLCSQRLFTSPPSEAQILHLHFTQFWFKTIFSHFVDPHGENPSLPCPD